MIYLPLPFSFNTTNPGFICEIVEIFRGIGLVFFITRITSHIFYKARHIRFVNVGIYMFECRTDIINDTNNFTEECRMLAFTVLLCYTLKTSVVGYHQITCTHQNKVLLEKSCSINRIFLNCVSKQPFHKITV